LSFLRELGSEINEDKGVLMLRETYKRLGVFEVRYKF